MIPAIEHSVLLTIFCWLLMIPIAICVLIRVTAFWADDFPGTLPKAVATILGMCAAVRSLVTCHYPPRICSTAAVG